MGSVVDSGWRLMVDVGWRLVACVCVVMVNYCTLWGGGVYRLGGEGRGVCGVVSVCGVRLFRAIA